MQIFYDFHNLHEFYILISMVDFGLVILLFNVSSVSSIEPNRPHQFQKEMDKKSKEFTGELFTKSESKTEDLISMMSKVQLDVHKFKDELGVHHCYERKIVSGDNKTEKNMHYGILRKVH